MSAQANNDHACGAKQVRTTCPYCGVGCGVIATRDETGHVEVKGDPEHPANFGRLCSKGSALAETLSLEGRLLHPSINGGRAAWDDALDFVAATFQETISKHGPDAVAFYVSGQILTEDYYVANKLMKGFIGSGNIDTNSRLCMASSVAGHKRAFGSDTVPGTYEDLERAGLVVLVGSNLAWCHPVLFQRLAAARETRGTKIVVIDPRATATCEIADMHLAIAPGSDVALFNGLLASIANSAALDRAYVAAHTQGFDEALAQASVSTVAQVARETGLAEGDVERFYSLFAAEARTVTVYSQGVNQSSAGTDKVNAIINCHLATGRIGKPGMGPFSVTGQPNAMGGRETGGLANMLAAHMDFGNADHRRIVAGFWRAPALAAQPGLKAVDMFRAVKDGRIRAIWIMATNPAASMPEAGLVKEALAACPFVVVSDMTADTDTAKYAHVLLPSTTWGEKDGTVTNSERRISRQRAFLDAPGEARADWRQMAEVAKRMGHADAFAWNDACEIFAEYATLTGVENDGARDLDISAHADIGREHYEALAPFQWPQARGDSAGAARFFADGQFFTPDRKARFIAVRAQKPAAATAPYPLTMNTGRIRDQWHTMTRSAKSPRLMQHIGEPFLEVHPDDAARFHLETAALVRVESPHGQAILRVLVSARVKRGEVFAPMHWSGSHAGASGVGALIASNVDPLSGQPELKYTPVMARPFAAQWYGFAVLRARPPALDADYWAIARTSGGWRIELAAQNAPADWTAFARSLFAACGAGDMIAYSDQISGQHRFALMSEGQMRGAFFVSRHPVEVSRNWLVSQLAAGDLPANAGLRLLAGRAGGEEKDKGAIVCACFDVGRNEIAGAIASGCASVEAVGAALKAGANCGSCRSEISRMLRLAPAQEAAREAV